MNKVNTRRAVVSIVSLIFTFLVNCTLKLATGNWGSWEFVILVMLIFYFGILAKEEDLDI